MSYLDKAFCASPDCQNKCGRRMTDLELERLSYLNNENVSYGYFCGDFEETKAFKEVKQSLDSTLEEIKKQSPELYNHLKNSIKMDAEKNTFCYSPD